MAMRAARRDFLTQACWIALAGALPPALVAAESRHSALSVWILRGGLDGLAAVPAWGDPDYAATRAALALGAPSRAGGVLDLDGHFGLHPSLTNLHGLYQAGELLPMHAVATAYRERSHFDGQKILENGTSSAAVTSGWLNRVLAAAGGPNAMAISSSVPLMLRGAAKVGSWAPSELPDPEPDTLDRIADLYAPDALLSARLAEALAARELVADAQPGSAGLARRNGPQYLSVLAQAAGRFMREPDGPVITALEIDGWDTHANQGAAIGQLANRLAGLDAAVAAFRQALGPRWSDTALLIVTEFGRTAAPNGTGGTDHGTAGMALLAGGAVNGGRVIADWPGLSRRALYQQRDLEPTLDLRAACKGVLADHLSISIGVLNEEVFPDSARVPAARDLIRHRA